MIRVGTAGFSYKDWAGVVYPSPAPRGFDPLRFLAGYFSCIEMNVTFYRVPAAPMVERWMESASDNPDFRFTFKLYRGITHGKGDEDGEIAPFLAALEPCRAEGRLGAILLQFPAFFVNNERSRKRLADIAARLEGWPCAVEVRHRSWLREPALRFIAEAGLSLCDIDICQDANAVPPGSWTTGPIGYVRLHGRNAEAWFDGNAGRDQKYDYLYDARELEGWGARVLEIADKTRDVYVVANNHYGGKAVANAFQLARLVGASPPEPPAHLLERFPELARA